MVAKEKRDRSVLITGAAGGIGKALVERFIKDRWFVIGMDVTGATVEHPLYTHLIADITDKASMPELPYSVRVIINNAGVDHPSVAMEVNLYGMFNVEDLYLDTEHTESIVNVSSISGITGIENRVYTASKAAIIGYTKHLAKRLSKWRIRVNSVSPGATITPINDNVLEDPELTRRVAEQNLLGRWAYPSEQAELIHFIAVNATFMTASDVVMDGGEMYNHEYITPIKDYSSII